jgi:hypothetical protein
MRISTFKICSISWTLTSESSWAITSTQSMMVTPWELCTQFVTKSLSRTVWLSVIMISASSVCLDIYWMRIPSVFLILLSLLRNAQVIQLWLLVWSVNKDSILKHLVLAKKWLRSRNVRNITLTLMSPYVSCVSTLTTYPLRIFVPNVLSYPKSIFVTSFRSILKDVMSVFLVSR